MRASVLRKALLIAILWLTAALPSNAVALNDHFYPITEGDSGEGYIFDVLHEHAEDPTEVVLIEKPAILIKPTLHDLIFNPTLSNEFLFEYQQRFGRTEQEQYYYLTSRQGYYRDTTGALTATTEDQERRRFAEYMMRRLTEYHVDNYMKTEPSMRHIYEVKQAVSNVKVQVGNNFKCNINYNYSGNSARATCENPIANLLVNVQMDPTQFLPTAPQELTIGVERPLGDTVFEEATYSTYEGALKNVITKNFSHSFSANLTGVTYLKDRRDVTALDPSYSEVDLTQVGSQKENLVILGAKLLF